MNIKGKTAGQNFSVMMAHSTCGCWCHLAGRLDPTGALRCSDSVRLQQRGDAQMCGETKCSTILHWWRSEGTQICRAPSWHGWWSFTLRGCKEVPEHWQMPSACHTGAFGASHPPKGQWSRFGLTNCRPTMNTKIKDSTRLCHCWMIAS